MTSENKLSVSCENLSDATAPKVLQSLKKISFSLFFLLLSCQHELIPDHRDQIQ